MLPGSFQITLIYAKASGLILCDNDPASVTLALVSSVHQSPTFHV
jgi:hypothetical protein